METTEPIYVDPSALVRLYLRQERSREMAQWRSRTRGPLPVTHHGRVEMVNAISLALFRGDIDAEDADLAWNELDSDFHVGNLVQVDVLWRAALKRAAELSRTFSSRLGTRSLDVLHVSCALELELKRFFSFDERQRALANAAGLKVLTL